MRHEKICTRVSDAAVDTLKPDEQGHPVAAAPQPPQQQTSVKSDQVCAGAACLTVEVFNQQMFRYPRRS